MTPGDDTVSQSQRMETSSSVHSAVKQFRPGTIGELRLLQRFANLQELDLQHVSLPEVSFDDGDGDGDNDDDDADEEEGEVPSCSSTPNKATTTPRTPRALSARLTGRTARKSKTESCDWCEELRGHTGVDSWEGLNELKGLRLPDGCCDTCVAACAVRFRHLDAIHISGEKVTDASVTALETLPLAEVSIHGAENITNNGLASVAEHGARLSSVTLHAANLVTDDGVATLAAGLTTNIQRLRLLSCARIQGHGLGIFTSLQYLDLSWCQHVTDSACMDLQEMASLRRLYLTGCVLITNVGVECLRTLDLVHLDLEGCVRVTDAALGTSICHMSNLTGLVLRGLVNITNQGLACLATCPKLEKLDVNGCNQIGDDGLVALIPHVTRLHYLDISGCRYITQVGLLAVARSARQLQHLEMAHCSGVGNSGLAAFAAAQLPLTFLNVSACSRITGTGIAALSVLAPTLETLKLSWCDLNDPAAIHLQSLWHLRHLWVDGCSRISKKVAHAITGHLPLKSFHTHACSHVVESMGFELLDESAYEPIRSRPRVPTKTVASQTLTEEEVASLMAKIPVVEEAQSKAEKEDASDGVVEVVVHAAPQKEKKSGKGIAWFSALKHKMKSKNGSPGSAQTPRATSVSQN